jgi:anaphase-promoting complex subunit 2
MISTHPLIDLPRNKKRLLHPGADTRTVIQQYVLMILSLRQVDPAGVLLYKVADPIRRYLRDRPDTIRCIVANLVGDDDLVESLVGESEPIQPLQGPQVEDYSDPNWEPEPIDAGPGEFIPPTSVLDWIA